MNQLKLNLIFGIAMINGLIIQAQAATQVLDLSTSSGNGTLYLSAINNETVEPNSGLPGSKNFDYPYYFDPARNGGAGLWVVIASEPLSASTIYSFEETNYTVLNKTITDPDVGQFDVGDLSWDDASLTGSGIETISASSLSLTLDLTDFSPMNGTHNTNNEFFWDYTGVASNLTGTGLTFNDGVLTSIDFTADVAITPRFGGALAFGSSYDGTVTFSGSNFQFNVDVIQDNTTFLGNVTDSHLLFDASGPIAIPEPSTYLYLTFALIGFCVSRRLKMKKS